MRRLLRILTMSACAVALVGLVPPAQADRHSSGFARGGVSSHRGSSGHWRGGSSGRSASPRNFGFRSHRYPGRGGFDRSFRGRGHRGFGFRGFGHRGHFGHRFFRDDFFFGFYRPFYRYWSPWWSWYYPDYYYGYPPYYYGYPPYYYGYPPYYYGPYGSSSDDDQGDDDQSWRGWSDKRGDDERTDRGARGYREDSTADPGSVRLRTSPGAAVYVDDRFVGAADRDGVLMLDVAPGQHRVAITRPGKDTVARTIQLGPKTTELDLRR
jgi:PEGA domain-containing protein